MTSIITYHSSTTPLFTDVKGIVEQTVLSSTVKNLNMSQSLVSNLVNGIGAKASAMYSYGRRHELDETKGYYLGLPKEISTTVRHLYADTVKRVIEQQLGTQIYLESAVLQNFVADPLAWQYMKDNGYGYDRATGLVANPPFDAGGLNVSFNGAVVTQTGDLLFYYTHGSDIRTETVTGTYEYQAYYYHAVYFLLDEDGEPTGEEFYWSLLASSTTYSELTMLDGEYRAVSSYYPVVPLREEGVDLTDEATRNEANYLSSKKCLNYLGVDIDDIADSINSNPNIDDVDHAYVMLGAALNTEAKETKKYLFMFFESLIELDLYEENDYEYWRVHQKETTLSPQSTIGIEDSFYRMTLSWNYIQKTTKTGSVANINEVNIYAVPLVDGHNSVLRLQKQITVDTYEELIIRGLSHSNFVYSPNAVVTSIYDAFDEENELANFVIPLNYYLVKKMKPTEAHDLFYDASRLVFNSRIKTRLKWYQTEEFAFVVRVILVVYTAYTWGAGTESALTISALLEVAAEIIVKAYIANLALGKINDILVDVFGEELGLLLTLVASYLIADGMSDTGVSAMSLYNSATNALYDIGTLHFTSEMEELQKELDALEEEKEEFDEMYQTGINDPLKVLGIGSDYTYSYDVVKDSPSYYYTRTIHSGNIGMLVLSYPEHFVNSKLRLDLPYSSIRNKVY